MRKFLMVAIGAAVLAAAVLILVWRPGDEQTADAPSGLQIPAGSQYAAPFPTHPSASPLGQDLPGGEPEPAPEVSASVLEPPAAPYDEAGLSGLPEATPEATPESVDNGLLDFPEIAGQTPQAIPPDVPQEGTEAVLTSESGLSGMANISGAFFDDLAGQIVASYLPPRSEHNPESQGRLRFHFSALNRRYGMDLVGLEHQSPTLTQGREEIFRNLLRPEALETIWALFVPIFEQALDEALQSARWSFPAPAASPGECGLTNQEQQEFYRLLSGSAAALANAVQAYADRQDAPSLTQGWLQAQTKAYAAHSRYQVAEAELLTALEETPEDTVRILAERLERDAAAQGIMQAIAAREQARENLLQVYTTGPSRPDLGEAELVYLAEWLHRRIHAHPERRESIRHMAARLRELSLRLHPGT